jgi:hypothetical protein
MAFGIDGSEKLKVAALANASLSLQKEVSHSSVHFHGVFFLSKSFKGAA